ncbi:MAG: hypothetical protein IH921_09895, partial [Gemmatimonadetes bacterium]|nr:hypothetical protein [Gemmatimonadota bacterium]
MRRMYPVALVAALIFTPSGVSHQALYAQDEVPVNRVIERLQQDQPAIGTFTRAPGPDLDFAVIDTQYGEFDIDAVRQAVADLRGGPGVSAVTPIVRIPLAVRDAPQEVVRQLLEVGVSGVMFPDIETREQAIAAVASIRSHTGLWPADPSGTLIAMLQIESLAGMEQLDEILAVPGIGVIFLGPTDLATSAGAGGPNDPRVDALVQEVLEACLASGVPCGYPIVARTPEDADRETARRLAEGFKVLAV